jgi:hypothetical protein
MTKFYLLRLDHEIRNAIFNNECRTERKVLSWINVRHATRKSPIPSKKLVLARMFRILEMF